MFTEAIDFEALDPGIRETVRALRRAGFETVDSGDGVTKPDAEQSIPGPHVVIQCMRPELLVIESNALFDLLNKAGVKFGNGVDTQASYDPSDQIGIIVLTGLNDASLPRGLAAA